MHHILHNHIYKKMSILQQTQTLQHDDRLLLALPKKIYPIPIIPCQTNIPKPIHNKSIQPHIYTCNFIYIEDDSNKLSYCQHCIPLFDVPIVHRDSHLNSSVSKIALSPSSSSFAPFCPEHRSVPIFSVARLCICSKLGNDILIPMYTSTSSIYQCLCFCF